VSVWDPATDTWTPRAPMPTARGALGVAVAGGLVYAVGGVGPGPDGQGRGDLQATEVYDPAADRWRRLAPMPTARDHLGVAATGGKVHAIGGRLGSFARNLGTHEIYDPAADRWSSAPPLPTPRSGVAAAVAGGRVLVIGGEGSDGTFPETEGYDPAAGSWTSYAGMPTARHGIGAAEVDGVVYVPTGGPTPGGSQTKVHEAFTIGPSR
jgi:N-acetylneuraminic acid mutarotase